MNFDFINSRNSTVIKMETCTVNVLYQLEVKCCIVKVFNVECNLSVKLNKTSSVRIT
jgi:hypothetical protein